MFPIRDHNPSRRKPWVSWALIAANIAIFFSYYPLLGNDRSFAMAIYEWGLIPAWVWVRPSGLVTSMFMHAGLLHLGGNMLFLWVFGDNMEDEMGHGGFLLFYLLGGIGAGLAQVLADPSSEVPMVGASGAIAAVMGGYLLLFPRARIDILLFFVVFFRVITVPAWAMLGFWFGFQVISGSLSAAGSSGVAYWAHAGGFLVGAALAIPTWRRLGGAAFWRRTSGHPPHAEVIYRRTAIPKVRRR